MASIDMSEVTSLASDFGRAGLRAHAAVEAVVFKGAMNVKRDMVAEAESGGASKHFSGSISFDRSGTGVGGVSYDIGPDKGRTQGALGNLLYFGSVNNGPVLDIEAGLRAEEPRFVKALGDVAERSVFGRG